METNAQFLLEELGHVEAKIEELETQMNIADTEVKLAIEEKRHIMSQLNDMGEFE